MAKDQIDDGRDREPGTMGVGADTGAMPDWDKDGKTVAEKASGWDSHTFDSDLFAKGSDPDHSYEEQVPSSGPAWPSNSKNRK